jgi:hypothetical protein
LLEENVGVFELYDKTKKQWLDAKNDKWERAVLEKFSWIKSIQSNSAQGEQLQPRDFAQMSDGDAIDLKDVVKIKNNNDRLRRHMNQELNGEFMTTITKTTIVEDYPNNYDWRDLFLKLCFEQMLQYLP